MVITGFASDPSSVLKWCLNRPHQAKHFNELINFTGLLSSQESYKPLRNSEIIKSGENVTNVIHVLNNEYLNPFDVALDKDELFNLSSGFAKEDDLKKLLNIWQTGNDQS